MSLVTIIIPTYNRAALLQRALGSLRVQTFRDFEAIVVDDGSNDETPAVIEKDHPEITYIRLEHRGLPAVARNAGLAAASGEYIAFLDSDDEWLPDKLEKQVKILEENPVVGLVCANAMICRPNGEQTLYFQPGEYQGVKTLLDLIGVNFIIASTVLARRSILDLVGGFSEDHRLKALEDYDLWLRVASFSAIYFLPETLANYWDYGNSLHSKQTLIDHWKGLLFILARLDSFLSTRHIDDPVLKERIRKQAYLLRKYTFQVHWKNKNYLPGIFTLWGLVIKHPDELLALGTRQIRVLWNRLSLWGKAQSEENMPALHAKTKLHLGCGEIYLDGYVNIDFPPSEHTVQRISRADRYADIVELSYPPGTIAEVRLHHVFENFDRVTALYLLMQWYQWLEEGGQLVIETPDFQACALRFLQNGDAGAQDKLLRHLFGSNEAAWAIHKDGWYENKYIRVLHSLGYCDLHFRFSEWQGTYNITVMAKKKRPLVSQDEQLAEIHQLLRHYLVNGEASELVTYQVWIEQLNQLMKRGV